MNENNTSSGSLHGGARQEGKTITHGDEIQRLQDIILRKTKLTTKVIGERDQLRDQFGSIRMAAQPFLSLSGIVRQAHLIKLENALNAADKLEADTGKGCSVCGDLPAVNVRIDHEDTDLWLCGGCVGERSEVQGAMERPTTEVWAAMADQFVLFHGKHHDTAITAIHEAMVKAAYKGNTG